MSRNPRQFHFFEYYIRHEIRNNFISLSIIYVTKSARTSFLCVLCMSQNPRQLHFFEYYIYNSNFSFHFRHGDQAISNYITSADCHSFHCNTVQILRKDENFSSNSHARIKDRTHRSNVVAWQHDQPSLLYVFTISCCILVLRLRRRSVYTGRS